MIASTAERVIYVLVRSLLPGSLLKLTYTNNRTCKRRSGRRCRTCAVTRTRTPSVSATCRPGNVRTHAPSVLSLLPLCRCGVYAAPTAFVSVDSCSTSIHVQARQGRHDEARKQARLSCCAVVSSWLRCLWRVGALSTRVHHVRPLAHIDVTCRHLLAASTTDDRLSVFRPPNNRLMSEWVEVCACCATALLAIADADGSLVIRSVMAGGMHFRPSLPVLHKPRL